MTELNTHYNGSKSIREKRMIQTIKSLAQSTVFECNLCDASFHQDKTEQKAMLPSDLCGKIFENNKNLRKHEMDVHLDTCEACVNDYTQKDNLSYHKQDEHVSETGSNLMVHHVENNHDAEFEMNTVVWDILLSEDREGERMKKRKLQTTQIFCPQKWTETLGELIPTSWNI